MGRINGGLEPTAYVEVFRILPDWTVPDVVLLRVLEAEFEILPDRLEAGVLSGLYPGLDLVEGDWILDLLVVIRVLAF